MAVTPPKPAGVARVHSSLHCHRQSDASTQDNSKAARKKLLTASALCLLFMLIELIGGIMANSLAIATDAAHLLTDFASFMISLFSLWMGSRPATRQMSFGWYRAEVIGALTSVLMIWIVTGILVCMAVQRMISKEYEIEANIMLISASIGVVVNIVMAASLHVHPAKVQIRSADQSQYSDDPASILTTTGLPPPYLNDVNTLHASTSLPAANEQRRLSKLNNNYQFSDVRRLQSNLQCESCSESCSSKNVCTSKRNCQEQQLPGPSTVQEPISNVQPRTNINVKAALIHVIGDLIQSVGVLIAALIIYKWPQYGIVDPICTLMFSVIVLVTTIAIIREALNVLMEGMPHGIDFHEVRRILSQVPGVEQIHDLHIWSLSMDKVAVSAHLVLARDANPISVRRLASRNIRRTFDVFKLTLQVEEYDEGIRQNCMECQLVP